MHTVKNQNPNKKLLTKYHHPTTLAMLMITTTTNKEDYSVMLHNEGNKDDNGRIKQTVVGIQVSNASPYLPESLNVLNQYPST